MRPDNAFINTFYICCLIGLIVLFIYKAVTDAEYAPGIPTIAVLGLAMLSAALDTPDM